MTKKKVKHTPGPWTAEGLDVWARGIRISLSPGATPIKEITEQRLANACLIAAAPAMYNFIKHLADEPCYELYGEYPEQGETGKAPCLSCQAKEIIAQAEVR